MLFCRLICQSSAVICNTVRLKENVVSTSSCWKYKCFLFWKRLLPSVTGSDPIFHVIAKKSEFNLGSQHLMTLTPSLVVFDSVIEKKRKRIITHFNHFSLC